MRGSSSITATLLVLLAAPVAADPAPDPQVDASAAESAPAAALSEAAPIDATAPPRLQGEALYLAQVVAQLGAEGLLAPLAVCPPVASAVGLVSPALGALAVDWVGREVGGVQGSQTAALVTAYGLDCGGGVLYIVGYLAAFAPLYLGGLVAVQDPAAFQVWGPLMLLALPGTAAAVLGLAAIVSRPFVTPLAWSAFAPQAEVEVDEDEGDAGSTTSPAPPPEPEHVASEVAF